MKRFRIVSALAAAIAATVLATGVAQANQIPGPLITGVVTAIDSDSLTIDGQAYSVAPDSPAAEELSSISTGQQVDVQLNGPASSPDTEIVNVVVHQGQ